MPAYDATTVGKVITTLKGQLKQSTRVANFNRPSSRVRQSIMRLYVERIRDYCRISNGSRAGWGALAMGADDPSPNVPALMPAGNLNSSS